MHSMALIGLGGISGTWDTPAKVISLGTNAYWHFAGLIGNPRLKLIAVVDTSPERLNLFRKNWGAVFPDAQCYESTAAMFGNEKPDVVDICTNGPNHFPVAMEVVQAGTKAIFLEKAPTCSLDEMDRLVVAARSKNIPITVSYTRHWSPILLRMEELLRNGLIGQVKTVVGYCPGWLLSMCSHQTDLICQFAGYDPVSVMARGSIRPGATWHTIENLPPGYEPEPHADVMVIEYASGIVGIQVGGIGEHNWGLYCDVMGTEGCVRIHWETVPSSDRLSPVAKDKSGKVIDLDVHGVPPEPRNIFSVCYDQIVDFIEGGPLPACTNEKWVAVHEIGFAGIESILAGGHVAIPNVKRDRRVFMK